MKLNVALSALMLVFLPTLYADVHVNDYGDAPKIYDCYGRADIRVYGTLESKTQSSLQVLFNIELTELSKDNFKVKIINSGWTGMKIQSVGASLSEWQFYSFPDSNKNQNPRDELNVRSTFMDCTLKKGSTKKKNF